MLSVKSAHRARLPIGTLGILLALIGWGLQYKTSLYFHLFQTSPEPPAKLLSDAERPRIEHRASVTLTQKDQARDTSHGVPAACCDCEAAARDGGYVLLAARAAVSPTNRPRIWFQLRAPPLS